MRKSETFCTPPPSLSKSTVTELSAENGQATIIDILKMILK